MRRILHLILISCLCFSGDSHRKTLLNGWTKPRERSLQLPLMERMEISSQPVRDSLSPKSGEAVSAYDIFKGAEKATITDFEGKTFPVKNIQGADELYDAVKFQVEVRRRPLSCRSLPIRWQTGRMPICCCTLPARTPPLSPVLLPK